MEEECAISSCFFLFAWSLVEVGYCIFFSQNEFALTNIEKSSTKESERKETKAEEELDPEVLEVLYPTQEWQALQPGTRPSSVPSKHTEFILHMSFVPTGLL
jgi:hypothetical protein